MKTKSLRKSLEARRDKTVVPTPDYPSCRGMAMCGAVRYENGKIVSRWVPKPIDKNEMTNKTINKLFKKAFDQLVKNIKEEQNDLH